MKLKILAGLSVALLSICQGTRAQIYDTNDDVAEVFAGSGTSGYLNAQGTLAIFNNPVAVAADSLGNLYVADAGNARIRLITTNGTVSTFAGGGEWKPSGLRDDGFTGSRGVFRRDGYGPL
jgi:hypothetical protein